MGNSVLSIDARSSRELQAVILAFKQMDRTIAKAVRKQNKAVIEPEWAKGVNARVSTPAEVRILGATARVAVADGNVKLRSGGVNAKLSGGLSTSMPTAAGALEFGANQNYTKHYWMPGTAKRRGYGFGRKGAGRHTQRQLVTVRRAGPVYNTADNLIPRIASLWVATTVKALHEAAEGKVLG